VSVSSSVSLPGQPGAGRVELVPLGGDGKSAPHGCYFVRIEIAGDASGGSATADVTLDVRYTNLVAVFQMTVEAAAGAPLVSMVMSPDNASSSRPHWTIVSTVPQVTAATSFQANASFMWFPPPVYYAQEGFLAFATPNVGVGETYVLTAEIYTFDPDVRRLTPMPYLQLNVPGVSAPPAI